MPIFKKNGPKTPDEMFEQQLGKEKVSAKEREAFNDFWEEERAIENADGCGEVTQTATGKVVSRHSHAKGRRYKNLKGLWQGNISQTADSIIKDLATLATLGLFSSTQNTSGIKSAFGDKVSSAAAIAPYEDKDYIYDTAKVSAPVYKKLQEETKTIASRLAEIEATKDTAARQKLLESLQKLAEDYEMRIHPVTGAYVHDYSRVLREEKLLNADMRCGHDHSVCVFLLKAELGDLRGIKSKVGDQYNQDPREAIAAGDHLKGQAPELHNV